MEHEKSMRDIAYKGMLEVANAIGRGLTSALKGEEDGIKEALKSVLKSILLSMIDYLEKQLIVDDAIIMADSIAKYGPIIGPIRAAASMALAHAPYEIAKGIVQAFDKGGFTGSGAWDEPKGIVHANEFVANRYATRNPNILPVLNLIDHAQRVGNVQNLTPQDVAAVLPSQHYATVAQPSNNNTQRTVVSQVPAEMVNLMRQLSKRLEKPLIAETYITGKRGISEAQTLTDKMKSNVSRR